MSKVVVRNAACHCGEPKLRAEGVAGSVAIPRSKPARHFKERSDEAIPMQPSKPLPGTYEVK